MAGGSRSLRAALWRAGAGVVAGAVVGVLWWAVAPTPEVRRVDGVLRSDAVPELYAAQDGTFALLALAAGVAFAVGVLARPGPAPLAATLGAVAGGAAGSLVAWLLGMRLGPPSPVEQASEGVTAPAPLDLHALGVVGVWPATTAAVVAAALVVGQLRSRRREDPGGRPQR